MMLKLRIRLCNTLLDRVDLCAQVLALLVELHLLLLRAVQLASDGLAYAR